MFSEMTEYGTLIIYNIQYIAYEEIVLNSFFITCRVEPDTDCKDEAKFIVFYSALVYIFSMFCLKCKADSPKVFMNNGNMVTVQQHCRNCPSGFTWRSQPLIMRNYPAGNILLSFAILIAGASIKKILLVFKHFDMQVYEARTFFTTKANSSSLLSFTIGNHTGWH
jgi:hypothetical protein